MGTEIYPMNLVVANLYYCQPLLSKFLRLVEIFF
jgi:hypothetical protein